MTYAIDLTGKVALITGAAQRTGLAIAEAMAAAGATVHVNDIRADAAEEAAASIRAAGGSAVAAPFDVTDLAQVQAAVAAIPELHILVNNAGNAGVHGWNFGPFSESDPATWERYFAINLHGVMHCTHAALPKLQANGYGRIVTIISDSARTGDPNLAPYAAAKAGAAGFMRSIARENGRHGITVNCVSLGSIAYDLDEARSGEYSEQTTAMYKSYIVRRPGLPEDVAPLVTLLASPLAGWITGQTIPVNGGYSLTL